MEKNSGVIPKGLPAFLSHTSPRTLEGIPCLISRKTYLESFFLSQFTRISFSQVCSTSLAFNSL
jgi:hypothetical protein